MKKLTIMLVGLGLLLASCGQVPQTAQAVNGDVAQAGTSNDVETQITSDGVTVTFSDNKITREEAVEEKAPVTVKPQQVLDVITYTSSTVAWSGAEKYITSLTNKSTVPIALSTSVSDSATGSITGGLDYAKIKATVGYTGTYTRTTTVTTNAVSPGKSVAIYSRPGGTKYFGYQRLAPVGVTWQWCNANPQNCPSLTSWTAISVTGIGFVAR